MSKRNQNTSKSKVTEDDVLSVDNQPTIDMAEFETMLNSFNQESTKHEVCQKIKELEAIIEEEVTDNAHASSTEGGADAE